MPNADFSREENGSCPLFLFFLQNSHPKSYSILLETAIDSVFGLLMKLMAVNKGWGVDG
ncbi:MAG: hypothetical protein WBL85_09715 [Sedimentisphaerales bacterium]